jgi:hypothetical protein
LVVDKLWKSHFASLNKSKEMANPIILKCSECQQEFKEGEMITFDDRLWCEDCLSRVTTICVECEERVYISRARYVNNDPVCESCYNDRYFQCDCCRRHYPHEDYGEDGCCRYCLENDMNPEASPDNGRYYSKSRRDLCVGVEIEAEGGDYHSVYDDLVNEGFGVQNDGSLSDGIEVQVPASSGGDTFKLIRRACRSLEENGFEISRRCGLHVHIEYLSRMKTIKRLLLMTYACEPVFYAINPWSRQTNNFCQPINKAFSVYEIMQTEAGNIDKLFYSKKHSGLTKSRVRDLKRAKWNECRYFGLNLHSLFYQRTVEFRYHAGTISPKKIISWVQLLKGILLYIRFRYNRGEVLNLIEQPTVLSKVRRLEQLLKLDEPLTAYIINRYIKFHKQHVRYHLR